jgi:hypothetical protein
MKLFAKQSVATTTIFVSGGRIGPVLHAGEGYFDAIFTTIVINTVSINHVLIIHHHE